MIAEWHHEWYLKQENHIHRWRECKWTLGQEYERNMD